MDVILLKKKISKITFMLENRTKLIEIIVLISTFSIIGNYLTLFFIFNEYLIKIFF